MKEQIMALVFKSIVTILTAILSIIIPYFIAKFKAYIEEKGKAVQYNRALGIARGMYFGLEDEFKDIEKSGDIKKEERSEEHTSELQSRQYLVCRLLLEKKKKRTDNIHNR